MPCTRRRAAASELDYTEQTSWLLFLKYLDESGAGQGERALNWRARPIRFDP
jgi:hypothetical protein